MSRYDWGREHPRTGRLRARIVSRVTRAPLALGPGWRDGSAPAVENLPRPS